MILSNLILSKFNSFNDLKLLICLKILQSIVSPEQIK